MLSEHLCGVRGQLAGASSLHHVCSGEQTDSVVRLHDRWLYDTPLQHFRVPSCPSCLPGSPQALPGVPRCLIPKESAKLCFFPVVGASLQCSRAFYRESGHMSPVFRSSRAPALVVVYSIHIHCLLLLVDSGHCGFSVFNFLHLNFSMSE